MTRPTQVHGYARVSTAEQGRSGLGLAAQRAVIVTEAERREWALVAVHEEVASGARRDRPVLGTLIGSLVAGDVLAVARLDRLTRSLLDFAAIVRSAQEGRWALVILDQGFDMDSANGRAMAGMLAVFAEYERELIGQRISEALRALPRERRNGRAVYDESTRARARTLRRRGHSLQRIAETLATEGVAPARGAAIHASSVRQMLS